MSLGRFDVNTEAVKQRGISQSDEAWELSRTTTNSFKKLATISCNILKGCQRRCTAARRSGAKQATIDLSEWISRTHAGRQVILSTLSDICRQLLAEQESPTRATPNNGEAHPAMVQAGPVPEDRDGTQDEGPWEAADTAYVDDLFKTGCFFFTQFYKERTREIRLAFVSGYRDALAEVSTVAAANRTSGLSSIHASVLTGISSMVASRLSSVSLRTSTDAAIETDQSSSMEGTFSSSPTRSRSGSSDLMAQWNPRSKREYVMDTEDEVDGRESMKRIRVSGPGLGFGSGSTPRPGSMGHRSQFSTT